MNYPIQMASITCLKELQLKEMRNKSLCYFRDALIINTNNKNGKHSSIKPEPPGIRNAN